MKHKEIIMDLGEMFVSEFVSDVKFSYVGLKFKTQLIWDVNLGCPVLSVQPPSDMMWGKYWYRSGINPQMVLDLRDVVKSIEEIMPTPSERGAIWVDIAANDGTLLKEVHKNYMKVAIDPCKGEIAEICKENCNMLSQNYFTEKSYRELDLWDDASVITCCAMFYDLQKPKEFLKDVYNVLKRDGVFVMQYTYTPDMLKMNDFMNICHEHYAYHDFNSVYELLKEAGFSVFNVSFNDVNGGSLRIYADKGIRERSESVLDLLISERQYTPEEQWGSFKARVELNRFKITEFVHRVTKEGNEVWGYSASTKGNTLLQYYNFTNDEICKIADANPSKYGRFTKGSGIEITSEDEWREANPKYTIILEHQFHDFFMEKEKKYIENGGSFIFLCPKPKIISKKGEILL
jgi:hypothetical protein